MKELGKFVNLPDSPINGITAYSAAFLAITVFQVDSLSAREQLGFPVPRVEISEPLPVDDIPKRIIVRIIEGNFTSKSCVKRWPNAPLTVLRKMNLPDCTLPNKDTHGSESPAEKNNKIFHYTPQDPHGVVT